VPQLLVPCHSHVADDASEAEQPSQAPQTAHTTTSDAERSAPLPLPQQVSCYRRQCRPRRRYPHAPPLPPLPAPPPCATAARAAIAQASVACRRQQLASEKQGTETEAHGVSVCVYNTAGLSASPSGHGRDR